MTLKDINIQGWLKDLNDNFDQIIAPVGTCYYVDGNAGSDTNNGLSWSAPFATLAAALAASHANIASKAFGWTARNHIYLKDDENAEDLVLLADKTDVIGVGSYDRWSQPRILGNHVPVGTFMGTRFINCHFKSPADGGDIWTIPATVSGLSFIGCTFDGTSTTPATAAIVATTPGSLTIKGNKFVGDFSDAVIEIAGTGEAVDLLIADNVIEGANVGIDIKSTITTLQFPSYIKNNCIVTTGVCIDDDSDNMYIIGNRCISGAAKGTTGFGVIDGVLAKGQDNRITGSDVNNAVWPAEGLL